MIKRSIRIPRNPASTVYFQVISKLEKRIITTKGYWNIIVNIKHPSVKGKENKVRETLQNPDCIRQNTTVEKYICFIKNMARIISVW